MKAPGWWKGISIMQNASGRVLGENDFDAIIHFAGHIVVPESVSDPLKYYQNNVAGSLNLIQCAIDAGVEQFVFSSSAAVYGMPPITPIEESAPKAPINPYGQYQAHHRVDPPGSGDYGGQLSFRCAAILQRGGAHVGGRLGQATPEATHLIKVACEAATGKREGMSIFAPITTPRMALYPRLHPRRRSGPGASARTGLPGWRWR